MPKHHPQKFSVVMFGARRHYAVPRILQRGGLLERFYTDICAVQGWPRLLSAVPSSVLPKPLRRLKGRIPHGIPNDRIKSYPLLGLRNQSRLARSHSLEDSLRTHAWAASELAQQIIHENRLGDSILYTFDRAGLELMQHAKAEGGLCVMEQTVAPFRVLRRLMREEQLRYPGWEAAPDNDPDVSWFAEREEQEWALADLIICGSDFVRAGIEACGGPVDRCRVVPYGVDRRQTKVMRPKKTDPNRPLRVLTVGEVGLRKGAPYVLEAAKRMQGKVQFRMVGAVSLSPNARDLLMTHVELTGQVPRTEVLEHFQWADVFLLPSLIEGSAGAIYEAMSMGLPIICTPNAGSVVRDGHNGFIVPIRDADAICDALAVLSADRNRLLELATNAMDSDQDYNFTSYQERLLKCLAETPSITGTALRTGVKSQA